MSEAKHTDQPPDVKIVDRRWWAQQGETVETAGTQADSGWQPGKPTYVEELERQVAEKDRQLQETLTKYRESAREFDDSRARLRKDIARDVERGRRAMLVELLEVIDNLDRAIDAAQSSSASDSLLSGVEMVRRLFLSKFESFGVSRIDPLGQAFDPARHDAVTVVPTTDASQDGLVYAVLTAGYAINDEILRPAMVVVAQATKNDTQASA
jgi:molecular chaperone GrpE